MDKKETGINNDKLIVTIAVLLVISGLFVVFRPYLKMKKSIVYDSMASEVYAQDVLDNLDNIGDGTTSPIEDPKVDPKVDPVKPPETPPVTKPENNYIGMLEISKINLKKGFVEPKSKYNDIKYNVTIIEGSNFPNVNKGNFILAAHSGTGEIAYFKNLYKLKVGDKATITYEGIEYTYKITKIYNQKKQGYVTIYRDVNKTTLTLITCTKNNKKSQTIYIAELI